MLGYVVYRAEEAKKNEFFIEKLKKEGRRRGLEIELVLREDFFGRAAPDFVINRTRDFAVSRRCEDLGVKAFHSSLITRIGNDKYAALSYLDARLPGKFKNLKWKPDTVFISSSELEDLNALCEKMSFFAGRDAVIKSVDGHGGSEVFLLDGNLTPGAPGTCDGLRKEIGALRGHDCLIQERIGTGEDMRVYVLGGQIYAAVLRRGKDDFRSNFSLGGTAREAALSARQKSYIKNFIRAFGGTELAMAGIDFFCARNGCLVFNELEEMAGSRMLYKSTDKDIIKDYARLVAGEMKKG